MKINNSVYPMINGTIFPNNLDIPVEELHEMYASRDDCVVYILILNYQMLG